VEKDYWVTEVLRTLVAEFDAHLVFKGGTSLSKGWGLIARFSEDVDLFLDPRSFSPSLGRRSVDRELKRMARVARGLPGTRVVANATKSSRGRHRTEVLEYEQRFGSIGDVANRIVLESGIASGREPTEVRSIDSILAGHLRRQGVSYGASDEPPFSMRLMHFRRTFVEKLFAIHSKVERYRTEGQPLGPAARHYYDLHQLAGREEVTHMLRSREYAEILSDHDRISRRYFPRTHRSPEGGSFAHSKALFPPAELSTRLAQEYERQCALLCLGSWPRWEQVLARFESLRQWL
jgi:predicted nucleotidyltransferase component of viral defense system